MIRSFLKIYMADIGVEAKDLLVTRVTLPPSRYAEAESRVAFFEGLSARVEALPGVESVALARPFPPIVSATWHTKCPGCRPPARAIDDQLRPTVSTLVAGPSYFATLGARIVEGREFTPFDGAASAPVVVVNERFASSTWPGERAPGKRLRLAGASDEWMTVVGVVGNIAQNDRMRQTMDPVVYLPFRQFSGASMAVFARTRVPPSTLVTDVRRRSARWTASSFRRSRSR